MRSERVFGHIAIVFSLAALLALISGCGSAATGMPTGSPATYGGTLNAAYEDALDVISQLALGTLKLEGTADAVTEAQAADLLPLWEALSGNALQVEAERLAVAGQIEAKMTQAQVAAIAGMALTQADEQAWVPSQGFAAMPGGEAPGGGRAAGASPGGAAAGAPNLSEEERAAMRDQLQNMTDEERAAMRAQFGQQGGAGGIRPGVTGGTTSGVVRAVIMVLAQRSGQPLGIGDPRGPMPGPEESAEVTEADTAEPSSTPEPKATPTAEPTAEPLSTPAAPSPTPSAQAALPVVNVIASVSSATTGTVVRPPVETPTAASATSALTPALVQIEDTDPGPPFSVEVSLNQATPNPLLDGTRIYRVSGLLRNDGDAVYAVKTVHITFFDSSGFRGSYNPFPRRRYGEYIWHGALEADFGCMLLAPGEACPFTAEIAAYDMGSFLVHADAVIAEWREPAPVEPGRGPELRADRSGQQRQDQRYHPQPQHIRHQKRCSQRLATRCQRPDHVHRVSLPRPVHRPGCRRLVRGDGPRRTLHHLPSSCAG
ncbi:MAG: hypothetical protein MUF84_19855 [Anaerolineae bacterium]|nr:hypothetical protein [Anaerolineae bacterium]